MEWSVVFALLIFAPIALAALTVAVLVTDRVHTREVRAGLALVAILVPVLGPIAVWVVLYILRGERLEIPREMAAPGARGRR